MTSFAKVAALVLTLGIAGAGSRDAAGQTGGTVVDLETPVAAAPPLQGFLRAPNHAGPSPAVVLLHACASNWRLVDERWGRLLAQWGYVTLAVDSFGPRGLKNTCGSFPPSLGLDAYRALDFLVQHPAVDPARIIALGFSQGGLLALASVERGPLQRIAKNNFRAAVAFYPPCGGLKDDMTVPTLILVGELDDWTLASECRNLAEGRDDYGISRVKGQGVPIKLIVLPGAYHSFDASNLTAPVTFLGHHLEFNQSATDQSIAALREFLDMTIGDGGKIR